MTESPEQRVARLEAELAQAKVDALQKQLAEAQVQAGQAPSQPIAVPQFGQPRPMFGMPLRFAKSPPPDTRLAPAPRPVPFGLRSLALPFSFWTVFALFMIAVSPIALWIFVPLAGAVVGGLTFLVVLLVSLRKTARRNALLKWGEVATVVNTELLSRGTYYSGTTVQNVRMAQAHGWTVERRWYSGPVSKTRVDYELRGTRASIVIRGLEFDNGVILADSRNPARALCVSSFPYDLDRDENGNWTGRVAPRVRVSSLLMLDLLVGWTVAMCWIWGYQAAQLGGLVRK